jgi:predicted porin
MSMSLFLSGTKPAASRTSTHAGRFAAAWGVAAACLAHPAVAEPAVDGADASNLSVQPYGILDAGVRHVDRVSPAGAMTQFASGLNTSRVGLRGTETIAPDLQATIRLEDGFNPGTGVQSNSGSLFDRTATVGLRWQSLDGRAGRMEGFGYELAATGATDPLAMALNLPEYSSPAAAGSKAPVLGANPLQAVYSYTYGQLRFNNAVRLSAGTTNVSAGVLVALGGVAGNFAADSVRAGHLGWHAGAAQLDAIVQQSEDMHGNHSTLYVLAGGWNLAAWRLQAGIHRVGIGAGFDSTNLGNGASSTGVLGSSTTVSTVLATTKEDFRFQVIDLGATWTAAPGRLLTLAAYKSQTSGAGSGDNLTLAALGKWFLSPRTALYLELDHGNSSGRLAVKPVSGTSLATAYMTGINLRF